MKDYNLIIAEIAASIVTDCLGESLTANTYYSADGNFIIMAFSGYPLRDLIELAMFMYSFREIPSIKKEEMCILHQSISLGADIIRKASVISLRIRMYILMVILAGTTQGERLLPTF